MDPDEQDSSCTERVELLFGMLCFFRSTDPAETLSGLTVLSCLVQAGRTNTPETSDSAGGFYHRVLV